MSENEDLENTWNQLYFNSDVYIKLIGSQISLSNIYFFSIKICVITNKQYPFEKIA